VGDGLVAGNGEGALEGAGGADDFCGHAGLIVANVCGAYRLVPEAT
jgi:hypothetical protein